MFYRFHNTYIFVRVSLYVALDFTLRSFFDPFFLLVLENGLAQAELRKAAYLELSWLIPTNSS
jgi:hypothetical protein